MQPTNADILAAVSVLIETYWNVNDAEGVFPYVYGMGLNRNILECKFYSCIKK